MSFTKSNGLILAALVVTFGAAGSSFAQQTPESMGIVRITDGRVRSNVQQVNGCSTTPSGAPCSTGGYGMGNGNCQNGNCPGGGINGNCPYCRGGCPHCRGGRFHGICGEHYCKHSPDYGYSPPAKYPLQRRGVEYTNYYPNQWYGAGGDTLPQAPMVYQPTDTTQLGYTYQHVPFWQPRPNMLPQRPIPAQWHITAPSLQPSGFCNGNCPGGMGQYGHCRPMSHGFGFGHRAFDIYEVTDACPTNGTPQPVPVQAKPAAIDQQKNDPSIAPSPVAPEPSPMPVQESAEGEESEPDSSALTNPGVEPGALPPMPTLESTPNKKSLPNNSATSNHIRRISNRIYR